MAKTATKKTAPKKSTKKSTKPASKKKSPKKKSVVKKETPVGIIGLGRTQAPTSRKPVMGGSREVIDGATVGREVKYPEVTCRAKVGDDAIDADFAKALMGWIVEDDREDGYKFKQEYHTRNIEGRKVRCTNNPSNRWLSNANVHLIMQEILRGKYVFNGEPIIIGKTGLILNGQHQLTALILADEKWHANQAQYMDVWPQTPPVIDKLVVCGVSEDDDTVNTLDTARPRTLADVLGRSEYFCDTPKSMRHQCSKFAEHCIKMLWDRTGLKGDPFVPYMTHSESLDFLSRHQRILECVKFIYELNRKKDASVVHFITGGYASALLYLMGSCMTDRDEVYKISDSPSEDVLDWEMWDKAKEFWELLAFKDSRIYPVVQKIAELVDEETAGYRERMAVLIKAWNRFGSGDEITLQHLNLRREFTDSGILILAENPVIGGIDIGGQYID